MVSRVAGKALALEGKKKKKHIGCIASNPVGRCRERDFPELSESLPWTSAPAVEEVEKMVQEVVVEVEVVVEDEMVKVEEEEVGEAEEVVEEDEEETVKVEREEVGEDGVEEEMVEEVEEDAGKKEMEKVEKRGGRRGRGGGGVEAHMR